jgi:hypothetical protein
MAMPINITFLRQKGQEADQAVKVAKELAAFIRAAKHSIHIAASHLFVHLSLGANEP